MRRLDIQFGDRGVIRPVPLELTQSRTAELGRQDKTIFNSSMGVGTYIVQVAMAFLLLFQWSLVISLSFEQCSLSSASSWVSESITAPLPLAILMNGRIHREHTSAVRV